MEKLRADKLIELTAEKLNMPEPLVRKVVNSFFMDSLRYYLARPLEAKGQIDLSPYFQIKISIPKLRYILSYKTYAERIMILCSLLYKHLRQNGKRQTGFTEEHARLVETALQRTADAVRAGEVRGVLDFDGEVPLQPGIPGEIAEIQREYFGTGQQIQEADTSI